NIVLQSYGTPTGGVWLGPGITNSITGFFCAGCTSPGIKTLTYQVGNCTATTQITVIQISAGSTDAACQNEPPFNVSGGTPAGGFWFGSPYISSAGVFTPSQTGTFVVTYSAGTCSQSKSVIVTGSITVPTNTIQLCKSMWWTRFNTGYGIQPPGGRFTKVGPGITNSVLGTFSPALAGPGIHIITYSLASGCSNTFAVQVLDIDVSPSTATTCPAHVPFVPSATAVPSGGTWSCSIAGAIMNSTTGLFNPSAGGPNSYTTYLVYKAPNGCPDTLEMRVIRTNIINADTLYFCQNGNTLQLNNNFTNINYVPVGGVFSGNGVVTTGTNYIFNPSVAGPGIHTIYYTINTCSDSLKMIVYPTSLTAPDRTVCSTHPPFQIEQLPYGATWTGLGITNPTLGIFTPSSVPPGNTYTVGFQAKPPLTCSDHVSITVYPFVPADILNLNTVYCHKNQDYTFTTVPPGGTLFAPSSVTPNIFNPSVSGSGTLMITYAFGVGPCHTRDSITIQVYPPISTTVSASKDSICIGQSSQISINASGGIPVPNSFSFNWSHGLIPLQSHVVIPSVTTQYTVVTSDGCSDPKTDVITVYVAPPFYLNVSTTPKQCFGMNGQATVNISPPGGTYSYSWNTTPVQTRRVLNGMAGKNYLLKVKNNLTGCSRDTFINIPGFNPIKAKFSPNPNLQCIPYDENVVTFLDISNGATGGTWNVAGTNITYTPGQSIQYEFIQPGNHPVILTVHNEGNCKDTYSMNICVLESTEIFVPDIFSPNNDGNNDVFYIRGNGIREMNLQIFDRWGSMVFSSQDPKEGWDGTIRGKNAEPGIYAYFLKVVLFNGKKIIKKGEISLVR
ncbi:MAG: gliding motility-associated C-terminal domain-containing protein, partial [Bacteroidia bacterium]|nr:gliding motility-associated C-terminal domain-containing protein [Bacteroidia bacterium]